MEERYLQAVGDDEALQACHLDDDASDRRYELEQWALAGLSVTENELGKAARAADCPRDQPMSPARGYSLLMTRNLVLSKSGIRSKL